jgi:hypothetical protein
MMSPEANRRLLQRASWSGFVYIAFLMVGILPLARFFPSQPPDWGADQITAVYHHNAPLIKLGMVLVLVGSMFYVPWTAILAKLIAGVEGRVGLLTMCQIIAGTTNVLLTAYPAGWWLTAAFRGDRSPELVLLLNDIAWLQFLGVIAPFYFVVLSLIYASFADSDPDPLIPRWVGWFNVFFMLDLIPLSIIFFFKTGPFAWNGIFGFYLPFVTFWIWFFVMTYTIRKALPRLADTSEGISV